MQHRKIFIATLAVVSLVSAIMFAPLTASAHCDTLGGPVVADARAALASGDATLALKWTQPADEPEVRAAFEHALAVRALGPEAQELADRFFFETLVRVHRAGEGAPYSGLRPAGTELEPGIAEADAALAGGSLAPLEALLLDGIRDGLHKRYAVALEAQAHAKDSVAAGRAYVAAYVDYVHFAERIAGEADGGAGEERAAKPDKVAGAEQQHQH